MTSTTDTATTRDGIRILTRHWAAEAPHAAPCSSSMDSASTAAATRTSGTSSPPPAFEGFAWDHRGFGASGGERAWVDAWSQFHDDVEDRLAAVRAAIPGRPVVLYGHSMGGLIALGYATSDRPPPDLLVLSAPGIDDSLAAWKHALGPILGRIAPHLRISNGIRPAMLSNDPERQRQVREDPLMLDTSTTRFGALAFAEQARVRAAASGLSIPTLVIHGEARSDRSGPSQRAAGGHSRGHAPDLRRHPPRAPQRARGAHDRRRRHRLAGRAARKPADAGRPAAEVYYPGHN